MDFEGLRRVAWPYFTSCFSLSKLSDGMTAIEGIGFTIPVEMVEADVEGGSVVVERLVWVVVETVPPIDTTVTGSGGKGCQKNKTKIINRTCYMYECTE